MWQPGEAPGATGSGLPSSGREERVPAWREARTWRKISGSGGTVALVSFSNYIVKLFTRGTVPGQTGGAGMINTTDFQPGLGRQ